MTAQPTHPIHQPALDAIPDEWWDALVVGAGPAGSTAALRLAAQGYRVLIVDKHRFPRDKVCGDGLIPDAIQSLRRIGLYERVREIGYQTDRGVVFSPSQIDVTIPMSFLAIKRMIFDEMIAQEAVTRGAVLCQGQVNDLVIRPDGTITASCSASARTIRARVAVIATGADVSLLRPLGMVVQPQMSAIAMRCYVRSSFSIEHPVISFDRSIIPGYAWIFPLRNDEYNVGCGIVYRGPAREQANLKEIFQTFITAFPLARRLLQDGEALTPLRGARLRWGLAGTRPITDGNVLAIGETIGATFPFTGEGIGKAMETGELAATVIHQAFTEEQFNHLQAFPRRLEDDLRPRYYGYRVAEDWMAHAWLGDLVAWRARKSQYVREALTGLIAETVDPRAVFSVRGMVKSLWM
ncbi:MAG: geranylgeranyl reductase family protein [Candidatus Latescibacteria bacterium]|nr:geranylgeranyl reductase family protein [Candidatus Latescibacterota bacterium]